MEPNEKLTFWIKWLTIITAISVALMLIKSAKAADELIGKPVANTAEAVGWWLADLATIPEKDRKYLEYVWIPPWGDESWIDVQNFVVNTAASQVGVIQLGNPIANGWMLRFDLETLTETIEQRDNLKKTWDSLAIVEPYFHIPSFTSGENKVIIAPHLVQKEALLAAKLSDTPLGIWRADWLVGKMFTTIEGGKYYDFLQVSREVSEEEKGKGITPLSKLFAQYGIFESTTKNIGADKRAAISNSGVTEKPRVIEVIKGLAGLCTITGDISDDDLDPKTHPLKNLLNPKVTAKEIIFERFNGTHAFLLVNDKDEFQDSVPDNIAVDTTSPGAHTKKLNPGLSCIRCHGPFDGFQPFENDALKLAQSEFDIFGDVSIEGLSNKQTIVKLAKMYAGNLDTPDGPIGRARRDYSATVYKIVKNNPFIASESSVVKFLSEKTGDVYQSWRYDVVTAEKACYELGLQVSDGQGVEGLRQLLPASKDRQPTFSEMCLKTGVKLNRQDFDHDYADMALAIAVNKGWKPTIDTEGVKPKIVKTIVPAAPVQESPSSPAPALTAGMRVLIVEDTNNSSPLEKSKWPLLYSRQVIDFLEKETGRDENGKPSYFVWNIKSPVSYQPAWLKTLLSEKKFLATPWMYAISPTGRIYDNELPKNPAEIMRILEDLRK